ncbi:MAG: polysaccharide biosynthesis tyrosine autokinase [Elusimicrobiota bacterium]|nr:MAG: polysaccharide biosynthesis tyrosine autokinase [Elusimicrobiota bacterium]
MAENDQEVDFDLSHYVSILSRRRWIVVAIAAAVFSGALWYALYWPPVYRATTVLNIEREAGGGAPGQGLVEVQDEDYFGTQFKLITSQTALRRVFQDLNLSAAKDLNNLGSLAKAISVVQVPRTRLCRVNVDSTDPQLAMKVSAALSNHFVEQNLNSKLFMSKDVLDALQQRTRGMDADKINQSLPSVVNNKLIQDIKAQIFEGEAHLADLRMKYTDSHPAIISLKSRLASMHKVLNNEVDNIVSSLKTELSGQLRANNVRIIDLPQLPDNPIRPRKAMALAFGLFGGLTLGALAALLIEMLDQTVRTQDDIERRLKIPFLGLIPFARQKKGDAIYGPLLSNEVSLLSESFRNLRTMVGFAEAVAGEPVILMTSSVQEEGKSFVASNLAVVMAQLGQKVLVVDGDLRRPRQHGNLRASSETGLTDFLSGAVTDPESLVQKTEIKNLDIITCGSRPPNPAELLNTDQLAQFVAWARGRYARVIVDCPPVFPISDILLWGRHVKPAIFVTRFGRTRVPLIMTACARLRGSGIKILGGVVNGARLGTMTYADGRYYEQYYRDYVDAEKGKERRS